MCQGNKRKPSHGDWTISESGETIKTEGAWSTQELSFDTEFPDGNDQQLPLQSDPDRTECFK